MTRTGWHTGIVIARRDLPDGVVPEAADFPDAAYFEFGWGHAKYYPLRHKTIGMMLDGIYPGRAVSTSSGCRAIRASSFPTTN